MTVVEEEASFPCLTTQGWSITMDADVENENASPFPKPWPQVIYEPVKSTQLPWDGCQEPFWPCGVHP